MVRLSDLLKVIYWDSEICISIDGERNYFGGREDAKESISAEYADYRVTEVEAIPYDVDIACVVITAEKVKEGKKYAN